MGCCEELGPTSLGLNGADMDVCSLQFAVCGKSEKRSIVKLGF